MDRICQQLGRGDITFIMHQQAVHRQPLSNPGLIVTAGIYCLLYSFHSSCGFSLGGGVLCSDWYCSLTRVL